MNPLSISSRLRAQLAVFSILRDLGVHTGEPVLVGELARHWADLGVRSSDLNDALEDLTLSGLISRRSESGDAITKTWLGEKWFAGQPAWMEYQLLVPRASRAAYLRQQERRRSEPVPRRRREDAHSTRRLA